VKDRTDIDELFRLVKSLGQSNAAAARSAVVPAPSADSGEGGYRGSVRSKDFYGREKWTTPVGSIVPRYRINLEEGASSYEVNAYGIYPSGDAAKLMLPEPTFAEAGGEVSLLWPPAWADEHNSGTVGLQSDPFPIQLDIFLYPHSDGQVFNLSLPAAYKGSGGTPWYTVSIYNVIVEGPGFAADVQLDSDVLMYDTGVRRPAGVGLEPGEYVTWKVDAHAFEGVAYVEPFWARATLEGREVGHPLDAYFWKHVRSLEHSESMHVAGTVSTGVLGQTFTNGRETSVRIGKITAHVGTAPTGAALIVTASLNGTIPIFATGVSIPASSTSGEGVPDAGGVSFKFWPKPGDDLILLYPGDFLEVEVTQVGSSTPGSDLTVQVFWG
jgi:hypothetical protein